VKPPASVVFDLDGTLIDSSEGYYRAERTALARLHGITLTREMHERFIGRGLSEMIATLTGGTAVQRTVAAVQDVYLQDLAGTCAPVPGMVALVHRLHATGHRLAVASGSPRQVIDAALDALSLHRLFSARVSSDEVPAGKPHPAVYLAARTRLGASRCVAVEDSSPGAQSATRAGMPCVLITDRSQPATAPADSGTAMVHRLPRSGPRLGERVFDSIQGLCGCAADGTRPPL
jgi:HAD superfamily hydrolase (TIGR01509 family)